MTVTEIVVQTQPSVLEWIAGVATAASAVVIAWQAWMTRKSVEASENAVEVAQAALTESQLARVESGVPRITVTTDLFSQAHKIWRWEGTRIEYIEEDHVFKLPRDADIRLTFRHQFTIRNDGPGTVVPRFKSSSAVRMAALPDPIAPGTEQKLAFTVSHSVAEWVALLTPERMDGERAVYPVAGTLDVIYSGPRDADVDETHRIVMRGSALIAVENAEGDWRRYAEFEFEDSLKTRVAPATRTYWRSRSADMQFEGTLTTE